MNRNQKILTGLAAFGLTAYLVKKYVSKNHVNESHLQTSGKPQKHMTDVFSNAKHRGTNAMA